MIQCDRYKPQYFFIYTIDQKTYIKWWQWLPMRGLLTYLLFSFPFYNLHMFMRTSYFHNIGFQYTERNTKNRHKYLSGKEPPRLLIVSINLFHSAMSTYWVHVLLTMEERLEKRFLALYLMVWPANSLASTTQLSKTTMAGDTYYQGR
jgi:hypothetical protein